MKPDDRKRLLELGLEEKIAKSKRVIEKALNRFSPDVLFLAWTGHKDSTTMLWLFRETCREIGLTLPHAMLIDDGFLFREALDLMDQVKREWHVKVLELKNRDVMEKATQPGGVVRVSTLNQINRREIENLAFVDDAFVFSPDSIVCTHLMKTAVIKQFILNTGAKALSTAIRWDEHPSRADETYVSPRTNPEHTRIHPMLHFTERDIWCIIRKNQIPVCSLYARGYRSLGARGSTVRTSNTPRWEQNFEKKRERGERQTEKEEGMARLRAIGYI